MIESGFHVPERYFKSHSVGCQPKSVSAALDQHYLTPWATQGGGSWPDWLAQMDQFRDHLAHLFGGSLSQYCPQLNISSALTKILYALPTRPEAKTILCTDADFPTTGFVFQQAERLGFKYRFVAGDITDPEAWRAAMDDTVGLVFVTHAFSNSGRLAPVAALCEMARAAGAISIIDVAQSAGVVPFNIVDWNADFVIGTGIKFLCCGPGACFLYAAPTMIERSRPLDVGWFSHADPFEMDIHSFRFAEDALRFLGGTPSPAPLIAANAALNQWRAFGLAAIQSAAQAKLTQLIQAVPTGDLVTPVNAQRRNTTLVVNPADHSGLRAALQKDGFWFDERSEGFRLSVHAYTPQKDIDALSEVLNRAVNCA